MNIHLRILCGAQNANILPCYYLKNKIQLLNSKGDKDYTESGYTYTVSRYLELAKKNYSQSKPKLAALAEAMETYGVYAQMYFEYNASGLVPADVSDVTLETVEQYKNVRSSDDMLPEGLTYYGSSLTLETITTFTHYFTVAEGHSIDEYTFTVSGQPVEVKEADGKYRVDFINIAAKDLDKFQTLTVSGHGKEYNISYCALSYARTAIKNNLAAAELSRALYKYFKAAEAYFAQ